jgi:hypothetical protein
MDELKSLLTPEQMHSLETASFVVISDKQLQTLLKIAEVLKEEPKYLNGPLRVLKVGADVFLGQETSRRFEVVIRRLKNVEEGNEFIKFRMAEMDALWEAGCCGGKTLCNAYVPFKLEGTSGQ